MKMTLTKALVELKKMDDRINRGTKEAFIGYTVGTGVWQRTSHTQFGDSDQAAKQYKSNFDSVNDLIAQRNKIKSAVVKANAVTIVKVGDQDMTIAEAIERKSSINLKVGLLNSLRVQQAQANSSVVKITSTMDSEVTKSRDQLIATGKNSDDKLKQINDDIKAKQQPTINDPNGLNTIIENLEKEIEDFLSNVDVELSVANAKTEIDV